MAKDDKLVRRQLLLSGDVQGVGLRWRARHAAEAYGLTGWIRNDRKGTVSMQLQGTEAGIDRLLESLEGSPYVRLEEVRARKLPVIPDERSFLTLDDEY